MLTIQTPHTCPAERRYILSVLFGEFLGLDIQIEVAERTDTRITCGDEQALIIADGLFAMPEDRWLQQEAMPAQPISWWDMKTAGLDAVTVDTKIPILYGEAPDSPDFFRITPTLIRLGLDLFGSAFFMLSRYEEVVTPDRDRHDRFPAAASLAYQEGFLDRPVVDEYVEILWSCLVRLWPQLTRRIHTFAYHVTHDVDIPFRYRLRSTAGLVKHTAGDVLLRHDPVRAMRTMKNWLNAKTGKADPYDTFDLIMDLSEKVGLKNTFYFITDQSHLANPAPYDMRHPLIRDLLRKIHRRGHEVGLHLSYHTYTDPIQGKKEFDLLKTACAEAGIEQEIWGARQHFLRWKTPVTFRNGADIGLDYDTTLGFADHAGFRCGVCRPYTVYDLETRQALDLYEKPLVVMDASFIDSGYMDMNLHDEKAVHTILEYRNRCRMFSGVFTLLWHNNYLAEPYQVDVYRNILGA